ncbi:MAG: NAD(P)H-dependent oxidoreductase [Oscillospiraceae bacterium]|nr:NAD(P)H-dependent oxidoreductase [Oscillospiraceae bacterium]
MLSVLRRDGGVLEGCTAGVVVTGVGELYTKDVARDLVLAANLAGCAFLGRPLVEATGSLRNFRVQAELGGTDEPTAFRLALAELAERLTAWEGPPAVKNVLALHASARATSNTLALWELVKAGLGPDIAVQEVCLQNGTLADCIGCSYTACLHFGQGGGCFYGGPMVDEVFPAVKDCDALVMLCANYNDALAANLTAFVNRLTALFRQSRFYEKRLYGLIVSGYSGGDLLARQLISGLNMNKSFYLPPRFCLLETANEKGSLVKLPGIARRGAAFAAHIVE